MVLDNTQELNRSWAKLNTTLSNFIIQVIGDYPVYYVVVDLGVIPDNTYIGILVEKDDKIHISLDATKEIYVRCVHNKITEVVFEEDVNLTSINVTGENWGGGITHYSATLQTGLVIIDGVQTVANDTVIVNASPSVATNGIYTIGSDGIWTRTATFDEWAEIYRTSFIIAKGNTNKGKKYIANIPETGTVGIDAIGFLFVASIGEVSEAPNDGKAYVRKSLTWEILTTDWVASTLGTGIIGRADVRKNNCGTTVEINIDINKAGNNFTNGEIIFTIPSGYRPVHACYGILASKVAQGDSEGVYVYVQSDGIVRITKGGITQDIEGTLTYPI